MAVDIPHEIVADILARLPVRDLLRYRSVAKLWRSLIDDPGFIKMQLDHAMKTASSLGVMTRKIRRYWDWVNLDCLDRDQKLNVPNRSGADIKFLGSCNGLVALLNFDHDGVAIWNPSTRRYRELRNSTIKLPPRPSRCHQTVFYGFAYDHVSDDYKLLRLVQRHYYVDNYIDCKAKVYSAKTNRWKTMGKLPYYFLPGWHNFGVFASNSLHFLACQDPDLFPRIPLIVAFDLEKAEYVEIPMPSFDDPTTFISLDVLGGSLCAFLTCDDSSRSKHIELWIMKEYRVKESWTKLVSFVGLGSVFSIRVYCDDRILVKNKSKIVIYDMTGERIADLGAHVASFSMSIFRVGTLVGLDERNGNGWKTGVEHGAGLWARPNRPRPRPQNSRRKFTLVTGPKKTEEEVLDQEF